jgi:serine/threonine protein kinase
LFDSNFILKLADFGFSKACEAGKLNTYLGTESYMAPEIHLKNPYDGKSVDLFAAAIVLFIMYSGTPAFGKALPSDPYYKLLYTNKQKTFWAAHSRNKPGKQKYYSNEFRDLIQKML